MFAPSINVDLEKLQEADEETTAKKRENKKSRQRRKEARADKNNS